jgi:hypothetical protein
MQAKRLSQFFLCRYKGKPPLTGPGTTDRLFVAGRSGE